MSGKVGIVDELGETALLLPRRIQQALEANDRLKLCFSLLQTAQHHADHPDGALPDLLVEQRAAGLAGDTLDLARSRRDTDGGLSVPGAEHLRRMVLTDLRALLEPLKLAAAADLKELSARERAIEAGLPPFPGDRIPPGIIGRMTAADRDAGDSAHILVMDLHKRINALQSALAQEIIAGARVWQVAPEDRDLIGSFMAGLSETAALKFDHPGLDTTATRAGDRLIIQNDIGTTDAHVLVLHVENLTARLTYTDVHARRLQFFQELFKPYGVRWTEPAPRQAARALSGETDYVMSIGTFEATDRQQLLRYLAFLGSQLVFLIDWNRARKRLQEFLPKSEVLRLLKWAVERKLGHRGFLQLGGERLLYEAIEFAQPTQLRYGERLYDALGTEATVDYLQFVLREAATGLLAGRSERFIRDEIKAELARRFRTAHASLMSLGCDHAERVFDLATGVRDGIAGYRESGAETLLARTAQRARTWEREGDAIVGRIRSLARRTETPGTYIALLHEADEAADGLEEVAFLMTHLVHLSPPEKLLGPVQSLATLLVDGAQEAVKMFEAASHVTRDGAREDLQDFFAAADRIVAIEHNTDDAERLVVSSLLADPVDTRTFSLIARMAGLLEQAADGLSLSALKLRDHLLNEVMAG